MYERTEVSRVLSSCDGETFKMLKDENSLFQFAGLMSLECNVSFVTKTLKCILKDLLITLFREKGELQNSAAVAITNMTSFECGATSFLNTSYSYSTETSVSFARIVIQLALEPTCPIADRCCEILSNVTSFSDLTSYVADILMENNSILQNIVDAICIDGYNNKGCSLEYLSMVIGNLTQNDNFRRYLLNFNETINRVLPIISKGKSLLRRRGVICIIKNCCFEIEFHDKILNSDIDVLPHLLLPLAGPEPIEEDVCEKLPVELQYLSMKKERESDPENRKNLLEALYKLCATRFGREFLRGKNTYHILKLYYSWETDEINQALCEDIIGILIRTEEEIGIDDLSTVEIPGDIQSKFEKCE